MARKKNEEHIKDVWMQLIKSYGLARNYEEYQIKQSFKKVMGPTIFKHATDIYYKNYRLYITMNNDVLRSELSMSKEKVIKMLNEDLQEELILDVVFS